MAPTQPALARRIPVTSPSLLLVVTLLFTLFLPVQRAAAAPLPAFPGAQGHGAQTIGGRGGAILLVTNLNDGGPGSLRAALEANGPRIVVFRVGGTIRQREMIVIREPFVTLAGQSAPGDGITIRGPGIAVMTHDVIIRGLRIRVGDDDGIDHGNADGLRVDAGSNVIVDHSSFSWSGDENLSTSTWSGPTSNVTFQWNIVSEGLFRGKHPAGEHSMGMLIYQNSRRISIHHNLFAHNNQRNPLVKGGADVEIVNNLIYDWGVLGSHFADPEGIGGTRANVIGNTYKAGPSTVKLLGLRLEDWVQVYSAGNDGAADLGVPVATQSGIAATPADLAAAAVLAEAGALPRRDAIDARIVDEVRQGRGRLIDSPADVGGWLDVQGQPAPADQDNDGMPDAWETARGLNPRDAKDRNAVAASGYTMVEEYLNGLITTGAPSGDPIPPVDLPYRLALPIVRE